MDHVQLDQREGRRPGNGGDQKEGGMPGTIKGAPYDIKLSVLDATSKGKTNVEMTYPKGGGLFYLSTWNMGKTNGNPKARSSTYYWRDDVLAEGAKGAWKGLNAGFERESLTAILQLRGTMIWSLVEFASIIFHLLDTFMFHTNQSKVLSSRM